MGTWYAFRLLPASVLFQRLPVKLLACTDSQIQCQVLHSCSETVLLLQNSNVYNLFLCNTLPTNYTPTHLDKSLENI